MLYTEQQSSDALRLKLGVLGELARGCVLFEPFSNPPSARVLACSGGIGVGGVGLLRGGSQRRLGLGLGVSIGALSATQKTSDRITSLNIVRDPSLATSSTAAMGDSTAKGNVNDVLKLRAQPPPWMTSALGGKQPAPSVHGSHVPVASS